MQNSTKSPDIPTDIDQKRSPPPSPPSPGGYDIESQLPRKRERELSTEPVPNPKTSSDNIYETARTPAKKNRTHLSRTDEEEGEGPNNNHAGGSQSRSPSPILAASPPQEMKIKVRQISQGVEDLSWKRKNVAGDQKEVSSVREDSTSGPEDVFATPRPDSESSKRPRDEPDEDANPRETKRPSPPPDQQREKEIEAKKAALKPSGFMVYASTSSPFTYVKGPNIFQGTNSSQPNQDKETPKMSGFMAYASTTSPFASVKGANIFSNNASRLSSPFSSSTPELTSTTPSKRTGFEAFASSDSPFASATRSKSPILGASSKLGRSKSPNRLAPVTNSSAFSSYMGAGVAGFSSHKRVKTSESVDLTPEHTPPNGSASKDSGGSGEEENEEESERENDSFGARLRASKDEPEEVQEDKVALTEQDVITGEEEEETIHQVRGKLYALDGNQWKERGTGLLKLNVRRNDGEHARLVMRKEAVYTLLLNVVLFKGMKCVIAQDPRYIRMSVIENGRTQHYNLRVGSAKAAEDLLEEINANIPGGPLDPFHDA